MFNDDPAWRDLLLFHEYFHGDTGAGLGAMHQTGWSGLVANLVQRKYREDVPAFWRRQMRRRPTPDASLRTDATDDDASLDRQNPMR